MDINDLKHRITDAIVTINDAKLQKIWQTIEHCLDVFRATSDAHTKSIFKWDKRISISASNFHRFTNSLENLEILGDFVDILY